MVIGSHICAMKIAREDLLEIPQLSIIFLAGGPTRP
jgi:hypothetical protein